MNCATTVQAADILETAVAAGSFNTLLVAFEAAGLVETLRGEGPFTVFAPTDDAFAALPEGTVANLFQPQNRDQLIEILGYHVVPMALSLDDVTGTTLVETVQGETIEITVDGDSVTVDGARVVGANVTADNGVIYVVDHVLLPALNGGDTDDPGPSIE